MPTILLARHGQASFGASDYDVLSERGEEQVAMLAAEIRRRGIPVGHVMAGSMRRQRQTADAVARLAGLVPRLDGRLDEFDADGILETYSDTQVRLDNEPGRPSVTAEAFQDVMDGALEQWIAAGDGCAGRESWAAFAGRSMAVVREAGTATPRRTSAVLSTSGGVIAAVCVRLLRLPDRAFVDFDRVMVNGGLTKISVGRRGMTLLSFNDHGHLESAAGSAVTYR